MNTPTPISLRIPQDVKDWLKSRANENCRTVSGEILSQLKTAKLADEAKTGA